MKAFSLGPITVHPYGLAVLCVAVLAVLLAGYLFRKQRIPAGTLSWFVLLCVPLSVLCARLGYCLVRFGWFMQKGMGWFFQFDQGGYILYGALAGGVLAALATAAITHCKFSALADALAAPSALLIGLCRLAEGLADEGWGWDLDTWFSEEGGMSWLFLGHDPADWSFFPLAHYRETWDTWYWAVYVLEGVFALAVCLWLLRGKKFRPGDRAACLVVLYAAAQLLFESMRQDSVLRWGFVRVMQLISGGCIVGILLYWSLRAGASAKRGILLRWLGVVLCMLLVIAMEFGVEKKIVQIEWFPVVGCHAVTMLAAIGILLCTLPLRHRTSKGDALNA